MLNSAWLGACRKRGARACARPRLAISRAAMPASKPLLPLFESGAVNRLLEGVGRRKSSARRSARECRGRPRRRCIRNARSGRANSPNTDHGVVAAGFAQLSRRGESRTIPDDVDLPGRGAGALERIERQQTLRDEAIEAAEGEAQPFCVAAGLRVASEFPYFPLNCGERFSRKARVPPRMSSVAQQSQECRFEGQPLYYGALPPSA